MYIVTGLSLSVIINTHVCSRVKQACLLFNCISLNLMMKGCSQLSECKLGLYLETVYLGFVY